MCRLLRPNVYTGKLKTNHSLAMFSTTGLWNSIERGPIDIYRRSKNVQQSKADERAAEKSAERRVSRRCY